MEYLCLRTCFVNDRLWNEGEVYTLPDDMVRSEKNFKENTDLRCSVCGRSCKSRLGLRSHMRVHKEVKANVSCHK